MTDISEIKYFFINDLIEKQNTYNRVYYDNMKKKKKEKKRQMIEQIKKERQENSLIFNQF